MVELDGVGSEQQGSRPCIVISTEIVCIYSPTVIIVPITSKDKRYVPTHHVLNRRRYPYFNKDENTVLCEQVRTIDKCRIKKFIGKIDKNDLIEIIRKVNENFIISE